MCEGSMYSTFFWGGFYDLPFGYSFHTNEEENKEV